MDNLDGSGTSICAADDRWRCTVTSWLDKNSRGFVRAKMTMMMEFIRDLLRAQFLSAIAMRTVSLYEVVLRLVNMSSCRLGQCSGKRCTARIYVVTTSDDPLW